MTQGENRGKNDSRIQTTLDGKITVKGNEKGFGAEAVAGKTLGLRWYKRGGKGREKLKGEPFRERRSQKGRGPGTLWRTCPREGGHASL